MTVAMLNTFIIRLIPKFDTVLEQIKQKIIERQGKFF